MSFSSRYFGYFTKLTDAYTKILTPKDDEHLQTLRKTAMDRTYIMNKCLGRYK